MNVCSICLTYGLFCTLWMVLKTDITDRVSYINNFAVLESKHQCMLYMFNIRTVLYTVHGSEDGHTDRVSYKTARLFENRKMNLCTLCLTYGLFCTLYIVLKTECLIKTALLFENRKMNLCSICLTYGLFCTLYMVLKTDIRTECLI